AILAPLPVGGSSGAPRPDRRTDVLHPALDERARWVQLGTDTGGAFRFVEPRPQLFAAEDGQFPQPQSLDPRVIDWIALWGALELRGSCLEAAGLGGANGALEPARQPIAVDRGAEALQLIRCRVVDPGRHQ